ncbi:MAG: universal stress protein [Methylococcaceae bacterium]
MLQPVADKLTNSGGIEVISKILLGKSDQLLCEYQDKHAIDMTVMGAFSHTRIHDLLLSSFTVKILTQAHKPSFYCFKIWSVL